MLIILITFADMIIELLCRYQKEQTQEDKTALSDELKTQELIQGENFDKEEEIKKFYKSRGETNYTYGSFAFNIKDIKTFNSVDEDHTCLRFYGGETYVFKVNYAAFRALFQNFTGLAVMDFTVLETQEKESGNGN